MGVLGEVHPEVLSRYEIQGRACLFEINFEKVVKWAEEGKRFCPLPKFPAVYRDLSLVVDETLEVEKLVETISRLDQPFIDEINLFDIYRGAPIPEGKKGVTYRLRYQATDRTLTDEEVNQYHDRVISRLKEIFQLELRK
jgi:phenylalanyl-tRNA synthetase beta chain